MKNSSTCAGAAIGCLLLVFFAAGPASPVMAAAWQATGAMGTARHIHSATPLPDGRVLILGGNSGRAYYSSAELYDPAAGTFSATGSMSSARSRGHIAVLLPNGKVLVAGGDNGEVCLSSAELYDPGTGTFSATGSMGAARSALTASLLPNGKVLITGGYDCAASLSSAELYDPDAGTFAATGSMSVGRRTHSATLLPNGKVLVAGGLIGAGTMTSSAELYDPAAGTFSPTGPLGVARGYLRTILLPDGKVLAAGGSSANYTSLSSAELYDLAAGTFSATGPMNAARGSGHAVILLPDGKVLVAGGDMDGYNHALSSAELYDPAAGTFSAAAGMSAARNYPAAALLPDGRVLMTGGYTGSITLASAELYDLAGGTLTVSAGKESAPPPVSYARPEKTFAAAPAAVPAVSRAAETKPGTTNVAVADFVGKNVSQADASIVADFLRTELVNTGLYKVMDRNNMETVLAEQKLQSSGCTEQSCAVEIGKLLNVRRMFVGSLSKLTDSYYITVNVVDVETGEITASYDSAPVPSKKLKDACKKIVKKHSNR